MVPPPRSSTRATSAHPPVFGVPSGKEWRQRHTAPHPSLFDRLFRRSASQGAPTSLSDAEPPVRGVEAGADNPAQEITRGS